MVISPYLPIFLGAIYRRYLHPMYNWIQEPPTEALRGKLDFSIVSGYIAPEKLTPVETWKFLVGLQIFVRY